MATDRDKPCTVAEMIEALSKLPQDALLYTRGYEDGNHDATLPQPIALVRNYYDKWYYGPHDEARTDDDRDVVTGYFIGGAS